MRKSDVGENRHTWKSIHEHFFFPACLKPSNLNCFLPLKLTFAQYYRIRYRCTSFHSSVQVLVGLGFGFSWKPWCVFKFLHKRVTLLDVSMCDPQFLQIPFPIVEPGFFDFLASKVGIDRFDQSRWAHSWQVTTEGNSHFSNRVRYLFHACEMFLHNIIIII